MECLLNASPRKFGLVVGAEALSKVVDWTDRGTCILFGDGAAAAVVECREGWPSIGAVLGSRGDNVLLRLPGLGRGEPNVLSMEGTQVFKFAVETVPACMAVSYTHLYRISAAPIMESTRYSGGRDAVHRFAFTAVCS